MHLITPWKHVLKRNRDQLNLRITKKYTTLQFPFVRGPETISIANIKSVSERETYDLYGFPFRVIIEYMALFKQPINAPNLQFNTKHLKTFSAQMRVMFLKEG